MKKVKLMSLTVEDFERITTPYIMLKKMLEDGVVTQKQYSEYLKEARS